MSCCKNNLLVFLKITPEQSRDVKLIENTVKVLISSLEYTDEQAKLAIEYAGKRGRCLVLEGTSSEVEKLVLNLAKAGVGAEIENKSLK
jgi:hypothetical protein